MAKFCMECGSELSSSQRFCPSCGKEYDADIQLNKAEPCVPVETVMPQRSPEKGPKEKMPLRKKVLLSVVLAFMAVGIGGHLVIKSMTEADKIVRPLYNALLSNDESTFMEHLTLPKDVSYDAKAYMAYLKTQNTDHFLRDLQETAVSVQDDGITRFIKHEDGSDLLRVKAKKVLYLYPTIEIIPVAADVVIETDLKGSTVSFNKKEFKLNGKPVPIGSYLPSIYTMEATAKDGTFPHTAKWPFTVTTGDGSNSVSLMKSDVMVGLDGDYADSTVYLNGKSTDKSIKDLNQIGPIFGDTEVTLHVQKKTPTGEVAESEEEVVTGGTDVYFTYSNAVSFVVKTPEQLAEETFDRDELKQFVMDFRDAYESALTSKEYAIIEPYLAPDSVAATEMKKFIGSIGDEYYEYNFTVNEVLGVELTAEEASVKTYEEFYFTDHEYETLFYQRDKQYAIRVDENGEYKVHTIKIIETKKN